jgi:hypothetical protein
MPNRPSLRNLIGKSNLVGAEVGVGAGSNALNILKELDIKKLYLVDPYMLYKDNKEVSPHIRITMETSWQSAAIGTLIPFENKIVWINHISSEAVKLIQDEELDFVYIDGNHFYFYVKQDIELWYPKVKIGGLVAGHDYDISDRNIDHGCNVKQAVDEFFGNKVQSGHCEERYEMLDWWVIK